MKNIDITFKGREFISSVLRYNSRKFNRIMGEARRLVFIERVVNEITKEYAKSKNAFYEITAEDAIDGIPMIIEIRKEYVLDTRFGRN